ncbi:hypothetical protein [Paralysiella testudinis]|uniref:PepSY domain-containing protein n=1 Tax=Paralysiella testudinis TaxID=2809020 RepID=A0A892ZGV6_9NEIS|nr:hypothetical protein [Paralysiella testudinis]QRQ81873.1 hypothetical protein JQU52_14645 [Paralysiella testudinis]
MDKKALWVCALISAFALIFLGGVVAALQQPSNTDTAAPAVTQATLPAASSAPATALSAAQALDVARQALPGAQFLQPPQLVDFDGIVAYEISADRGLIYIDANKRQVLSAPGQPMAQPNPANQQYVREHDEHEESERDDG